jgi:transcriptional regulator with XRE-family HTH domain
MIDRDIFNARMKAKKMEVGDIARPLGVTKITVYGWRAGRHAPTRMDQQHVAKLLGIDPLLLAGVPVPYSLEFEQERKLYRDGYLAALAGRSNPERTAPDKDHLPWALGYRAGQDAVSYGFRE